MSPKVPLESQTRSPVSMPPPQVILGRFRNEPPSRDGASSRVATPSAAPRVESRELRRLSRNLPTYEVGGALAFDVQPPG